MVGIGNTVTIYCGNAPVIYTILNIISISGGGQIQTLAMNVYLDFYRSLSRAGEQRSKVLLMSMQSIILAIIALLSFPIGLIVGVFVGILVQDLREINKLLPARQDVSYRSSCISDRSDRNEYDGPQFFGDDR